MSLAKAVEDVITYIEADAETTADAVLARLMLGYARMLKVAVQANEGTMSPQAQASIMPAELQHAVMIEKARAEFRKGKQEEREPVIVELVDGPLIGDYAPIAHDMPVGAKTCISGHVYYLDGDRKLHFLETAPVK